MVMSRVCAAAQAGSSRSAAERALTARFGARFRRDFTLDILRASYPRDMASTPDVGDRVPIENVRCGDPIYDADGGCQHYKVLESRPLPGGGVVLELECLHDNKCQVIEKTFSAGYTVARSTRHFL
jgi:hypothetical protein